MKRATILILAAAVSCTQPAAEAPRPDANAIHDALSAELAKFVPSMEQKDAVAHADIYTSDATLVLAVGQTYTGRAAIEAMNREWFAMIDSIIYEPPVIDRLIVASDSEAVTFTHSRARVKDKGEPWEDVIALAADLWKKGTDGTWRIAHEINAYGPDLSPAARLNSSNARR